MNSIGIQEIGIYLPIRTLDVYFQSQRFQIEHKFIDEKLGFKNLCIKEDFEESSDLCVKAYENLSQKLDLPLGDVECLVVVTQNPDGYGLPHTSAIVHKKLDLHSDVACFDISLGCSGYVQALSIITSFMQTNQMKCGLLFTADPYSKVINRNDRNTSLLFGDGATCTLISDSPRYTVGKTLHHTSGSMCHAIEVQKESRYLHMDGNQVFRFVAVNVPRQIDKCLHLNECHFDEVDLFLIHQGSKYIVEMLAKSLKIPLGKMPFKAETIGNTVSSSLPIMLTNYLNCKYNSIILSGFGVGLSSATTLLRLS
jgi:3-oxoacyl-[acyl-carrier-protein] synthase-3